MKSVQYNGNTYFLDGHKPEDDAYKSFFRGGRGKATEEVDYFLAKRKHFHFHPQHLHDGFDDLAWLNGFFSDIDQPTENEVRRAMLMVKTIDRGDGPMEKYSLKSGGGTCSDSIFCSSLSIVISHPETGEDTWRVLMKKYSTDFKDILITYKELCDLFEIASSKEHKSSRDKGYAKDVVGFLLGSCYSGKIVYSKKAPVPYTKQAALSLIENCLDQAEEKHWNEAFDFFYEKLQNDMLCRYEEKPGRDVNQEHQISCLKRLAALKEIKGLFGFSPKGALAITQQVEMEQLVLF
jgi:hypothetical protein